MTNTATTMITLTERDGTKIPGEPAGAVTCPRRGSFVRMRLFDEGRYVGTLRVRVKDIRFTAVQRQIIEAATDVGRTPVLAAMPFNRLVAMGLVEDRRFYGNLTAAGWAAKAALGTEREHPKAKHKIGYSAGSDVVGYSYAPDGCKVERLGYFFKAWCSCGGFRYDDSSEGPRRSAVQHHLTEVGAR